MRSTIFLTALGLIGIYVAVADAKATPADDIADSRPTEEMAHNEEDAPEEREGGKCKDNKFNLSDVG